MLSIALVDTDGGERSPKAVIKLTVEADEAVPADSLYAELADPGCPEIAQIRLYNDGTEVFRGVVDEQTRIMSSSGELLKISARSPAAYLLDNEAEPCAYDHPSAGLIAERYAEPFGITLGGSDRSVYFGRQDVLKGASCYSAVKRFSAACYSGIPRISSTGELYLTGVRGDGEARFGNAEGEIRFTRLEECRRRCNEISEVMVKTTSAGGYGIVNKNADAIKRGIKRRRYLDAALTESPIKCAEAMIENGRRKAYSLKLRCPTCLLGYEGKSAVVNDKTVSENSGLYISALRYHLMAGGEYTDVTLTRRKS